MSTMQKRVDSQEARQAGCMSKMPQPVLGSKTEREGIMPPKKNTTKREIIMRVGRQSVKNIAQKGYNQLMDHATVGLTVFGNGEFEVHAMIMDNRKGEWALIRDSKMIGGTIDEIILEQKNLKENLEKEIDCRRSKNLSRYLGIKRKGKI